MVDFHVYQTNVLTQYIYLYSSMTELEHSCDPSHWIFNQELRSFPVYLLIS